MDPFQTQAQQVPDLLTHLKAEYTTQVGGAEAAQAAPFIRWAYAYLAENRPVENFSADNNHGVRLTNNVRVLICPPQDLRGTTVDAGAVEITNGASQPGQSGISSTDSQKVI